jgi:hypothetical protein
MFYFCRDEPDGYRSAPTQSVPTLAYAFPELSTEMLCAQDIHTTNNATCTQLKFVINTYFERGNDVVVLMVRFISFFFVNIISKARTAAISTFKIRKKGFMLKNVQKQT